MANLFNTKPLFSSLPNMTAVPVPLCLYNQHCPLQFDFVVMANLFNTKMLLHHKFDLKGSTLGRTAGGGRGKVKGEGERVSER